MVYPTDSCYALGCQIGNKDALDRLRRVRDIDERHHFTLVCSSLSEIARYAVVDNVQYRMLRMATPGSYTFILRAGRDVPKRVLNARRKTIGCRVPDHPVVSALLEELGEPILSSTQARNYRHRISKKSVTTLNTKSISLSTPAPAVWI